MPNIKLRLGRVVGGRQKGVDALIYRDLMTLARERAMATAYLMAGDEDLREGVIAAQEMGIRVVLLGIPSVKGKNQSDFLIREADEHYLIDKAFWSPFFSAIPVGPEVPEEVPDPDLVAREFAISWAENATEDELRRLLGQAPRIPSDLDGQLLKHVQSKIGAKLWEKREARQVLRKSFFNALQGFERTRRAKGTGGSG